MGTILQKRLAKAIVENAVAEKPLNMGQMIEKVGYSKAVSIGRPGEILQQKGLNEELDALGFSLEAADLVVKTVLKTARKDENKIRAAQEIYKRLGGYAPEKKANLNVNVNADATFPSDKAEQIRQEYEAKLRESITQEE